MSEIREIHFAPNWPEADPKFLRPEIPPAPQLLLDDVFHPRFSTWAQQTAEAKSAPLDYVVLSVLSVLSSVIGNARWVSPWRGWAEPPVIWAMLIGLPSAGKSPAIDAALQPLRAAEGALREAAAAERAEWAEKAEIAKIAESAWRDAVKAALKAGETPPERPREADAGPEPHLPRLVVNDATIERLGAILADQPRGTLAMRDELAGWLEGMDRYSGGGDRAFWLEAYGGRGYTVERIGRNPVTIDRLTVAVLGGIQPDRLKPLLLKADDDGLLARFLPIWPEPAPLRRPGEWADEDLIQRAIERILKLDLLTDEQGRRRPWIVGFTDDARDLMDEFRRAVREWESHAEGLMLSFVGKMPGLAARLSLVLALLEWASEGDGDEPHEITVAHFGRAAHLVEAYILPMARRAYSDAAMSKAEKSARKLVQIIRDQGWRSFTSRDVLRLDRAGLGTKTALDPALDLLIEGDVICAVTVPTGPQGGRPVRQFAVNPAVFGGAA